jgi:hypothetical protein
MSPTTERGPFEPSVVAIFLGHTLFLSFPWLRALGFRLDYLMFHPRSNTEEEDKNSPPEVDAEGI